MKNAAAAVQRSCEPYSLEQNKQPPHGLEPRRAAKDGGTTSVYGKWWEDRTKTFS
jgi:hypothetical protein